MPLADRLGKVLVASGALVGFFFGSLGAGLGGGLLGAALMGGLIALIWAFATRVALPSVLAAVAVVGFFSAVIAGWGL